MRSLLSRLVRDHQLRRPAPVDTGPPVEKTLAEVFLLLLDETIRYAGPPILVFGTIYLLGLLISSCG